MQISENGNQNPPIYTILGYSVNNSMNARMVWKENARVLSVGRRVLEVECHICM